MLIKIQQLLTLRINAFLALHTIIWKRLRKIVQQSSENRGYESIREAISSRFKQITFLDGGTFFLVRQSPFSFMIFTESLEVTGHR